MYLALANGERSAEEQRSDPSSELSNDDPANPQIVMDAPQVID